MKQKLEWLEFGRGIAAFSVVLCHISWGLVKLPDSINFISGWGDWGVSFFFVLSGFIIFHVHQDDLSQPSRAARFAKRRSFRIFPTYWLVLGLLFALRALPLGDANYTPAFSLSYVLDNLFLLPGVDPAIPPAWSLRNELLFYFMFFIGIINLSAGIAIFAAWMAVVLAAFVLIGAPLHPDNSAWSIFSNVLNLFFGAGVFIALALRRQAMISVIVASVIFAAIAFALGQMILTRLGFSAAIVSILVLLSARNIAAPPFSRWAGQISYPLYICHVPIMLIARGISKKLSLMPTEWLTISAFGISLCLIGAHLISKIEKPFLKTVRTS